MHYAYFLDTGTGKTLATLSILNKHSDIKWVVVCPKSIMKTAWRDDAKKFYHHLKLFVWDRDTKKDALLDVVSSWGVVLPHRLSKEEMFFELAKQADIVVINPEQFVIHAEKLVDRVGLIIDESTTIKNPSANITKKVKAFADHCDRVYILSGEPIPNGLEDYYSQISTLDQSILGGSYTGFKSRYFIPCGYQGYDIRPRPGAEDEIAGKVSKIAYFVKKEDCLDLPEKTYLTKEFTLPPDARNLYSKMYSDFLADIKGEDLLLVGSKAAAIMKLRQIVSGFIIDAEGKVHGIHKTRLNLLQETLDEIGKHQVIIWAQFREEIRQIADMLKDAGKTVCTANGDTKDLQDSIDGFKSGKYQYIICHPSSVKFGVTFTNCSYAVYYSYSYNYEEYYQSHDRIYRLGQSKPCTYITLKAERTIDDIMLRAVKEKAGLSQFVTSLIRGY
jgi:SNF2 family DNA or RNA helicase